MTTKLCFFGPMIGKYEGQITTQEFLISSLLRSDVRYEITAVSSSLNRYVRLFEMSFTTIRLNRSIDIGIISVYGGASSVVEHTVSALCKVFGVPTVMVLHGGALPMFAGRYPYWMRSLLSRASVVVAPSSYLADSMRLYTRTRIRIIPNMIDETKYSYKQRNYVAPRLFWMRSFHAVYNPHMALEVVSRLRTKYPGVKLVMAGMDKGELASCIELADRLGLNTQVEFPGFINAQQKKELALGADIFINTSRIDNTPVAHLEAAALGLPIVTTDVGGISHIFEHEENALLVPNEDADEMVAQIERLLEMPTLAAKLSQNGRAVAERSFWSRVQPQWDRLFGEVLSKRDSK